MRNLIRNLLFSLRMLLKGPGFVLTVVATLALGIGANTAIFTVVYATLLAPLPYRHPEQLVMVWSKIQGNHDWVSAGDYLDWKQQSHVFQDLNAWTGGQFNLAGKDAPEMVEGDLATPGMYRAWGLPLLFGRHFLPDEGQEGKDRVVILMNKLWRHLGADPNIIGKQIQLNGKGYTVVGVFRGGQPDRFGGKQLVIPLSFKPERIDHDSHWVLVMGRLKPGVTLQQAQADMDAVTAQLAQSYPKSNKGWGASVEPFKNAFNAEGTTQKLWMLLAAVGFVLLIACVNVANLLLAKGTTRQREVAVRSSLGATRADVFTQFVTESLSLSLVGGAMGVGVGYAMLQGLMAIMPRGTLSSEADPRLNLPVLLFALGAATLSGMVCGCLPAWYAMRVDPAEFLKDGGRTGTSAGRHWLRRILVTSEFTLALALLAAAGLATHSFWNLTQVDLGVKIDHVLTFSLFPPDGKLKGPEQTSSYFQEMLRSIRSSSGVLDAAAVVGMPLEGPGFASPFSIAGKAEFADPSHRPHAGFQMVSSGYFQTFGVRVVRGSLVHGCRQRIEREGGHGQRAVREEVFSRHRPYRAAAAGAAAHPRSGHAGNAAAMGNRGRLSRRSWQPVAGAARRNRCSISTKPLAWRFYRHTHYRRSSGDDQDHLGRRALHRPADSARRAEDAGPDPRRAPGQPKILAAIVFRLRGDRPGAGCSRHLRRYGLCGEPTHTRDRRAHGAGLKSRTRGPDDSQGRPYAGAGGRGPGADRGLLLGRGMQSTLYGVPALDFTALATVSLLLLGAGLVACYLPARRAASVDPMHCLRSE